MSLVVCQALSFLSSANRVDETPAPHDQNRIAQRLLHEPCAQPFDKIGHLQQATAKFHNAQHEASLLGWMMHHEETESK